MSRQAGSSRLRTILAAFAVLALVLAAWVGVSILTLPSVAPLAKPGVSMTVTGSSSCT